MTMPYLARLVGTTKQTIYKYETGVVTNIPLPRVEKIASSLGVSAAWILGWEDIPPAENIIPLPKMKTVPLLGTIACGEPILAAQNLDGSVEMPDNVRADFALRCKGDSMINARIFDGDVVYIRQQETVDDGEIAAVLIGDEATLKRVRLFADHIVLAPENPQYKPLSFWGEEAASVRILGKAVAFTSVIL
ncbi:MAG: helix-turn-helix domain-containing protein [Oscillospiraceae bacterium]|nr:helix-turn-helix domain-containing protein [Oscillospiraceae bacterium]